jgi:hypothetical protein
MSIPSRIYSLCEVNGRSEQKRTWNEGGALSTWSGVGAASTRQTARANKDSSWIFIAVVWCGVLLSSGGGSAILSYLARACFTVWRRRSRY